MNDAELQPSPVHASAMGTACNGHMLSTTYFIKETHPAKNCFLDVQTHPDEQSLSCRLTNKCCEMQTTCTSVRMEYLLASARFSLREGFRFGRKYLENHQYLRRFALGFDQSNCACSRRFPFGCRVLSAHVNVVVVVSCTPCRISVVVTMNLSSEAFRMCWWCAGASLRLSVGWSS